MPSLRSWDIASWKTFRPTVISIMTGIWSSFLNRFQSEYVPCVSSCIDSMIAGDTNLFFKSLKQLTKGQLAFLRPMITENTLDLFTANYDFNFGVKISGSGGGGYVLGFTDDVYKASDLLKDFDVIWL